MIATHSGIAIGQYVEAPPPGPDRARVSLPPRVRVLAAREGLLAHLHLLLTSRKGPQPQAVVLCGLGGVGKSSVATEYAYRHLSEVAVAWHLSAENQTVLAHEFRQLAAQLGVLRLADIRDPVRSVHSALADYPAEWLLIFDNALDEASVHRFIPPAGRGRLLITSQNAHWSALNVIEVPILDRQASSAFLRHRTSDPDLAAAAELAQELGGLPLALEQAAAYANATGSSLAEYLDLFRQRRSDVLERGEVANHPANVVATVGLAASRLERDSPSAAGLLRLLACLAPEPIPLALLLSPTERTDLLASDVTAAVTPLFSDQLEGRDAIAALRRYSLINLSADQSVLVHRLVQAVTADQMSAEQTDAWRQVAAARLEAAIPGDAAQPRYWPVFAELLPRSGSLGRRK